MANSTTNLDLVIQSQSGKEITINALADASSPATVFGRRQSTCTGLTWGFYGGMFDVGGTATPVANGTLTLTASSTCYIVALRSTGVVSFLTTSTNWNNTGAYKQLYQAVTGVTTVTSYTDYRTVSNIPSNAPRVQSIASTATAPIDVDNFDVEDISALAVSCTVAAPTGTPSDEQAVVYRIRDNGTAQTLAWNATFHQRGSAMPTTTVINKVVRVVFLWNANLTTWDCVATIQEI